MTEPFWEKQKVASVIDEVSKELDIALAPQESNAAVMELVDLSKTLNELAGKENIDSDALKAIMDEEIGVRMNAALANSQVSLAERERLARALKSKVIDDHRLGMEPWWP